MAGFFVRGFPYSPRVAHRQLPTAHCPLLIFLPSIFLPTDLVPNSGGLKYRRQRARIELPRMRPRVLRSLGLQFYPSRVGVDVICIGLPTNGQVIIVIRNKLDARAIGSLFVVAEFAKIREA